MGTSENTLRETGSIELPPHLPAPSRISVRALEQDGAAEKVSAIAAELSVSDVTARILIGRGHETPEAAKSL